MAKIYIKEVFIRHRVLIKTIRQRFKIRNSILGGILSGIRGLRNNVNSILPINRQLNKKTKLNIRIVFRVLY